MDQELTRQGRLSAMLIVAAIAVPAVAMAGMLLLRRYYVLVRYNTHTLELWLVLDMVMLAVGLILRENAELAKTATRRNSNARRRRR